MDWSTWSQAAAQATADQPEVDNWADFKPKLDAVLDGWEDGSSHSAYEIVEIQDTWETLSAFRFPQGDPPGLVKLIKSYACLANWPDPFLGTEFTEVATDSDLTNGEYFWYGNAWSARDGEDLNSRISADESAWREFLSQLALPWDGSDETWESAVLDRIRAEVPMDRADLANQVDQLIEHSRNWDSAYAWQYLEWYGVRFVAESDEVPGDRTATIDPASAVSGGSHDSFPEQHSPQNSSADAADVLANAVKYGLQQVPAAVTLPREIVEAWTAEAVRQVMEGLT
ncbi:hypothetical protein [Streptomyces sp. NPDC126514]|uniref:hypothetical protein n=1 Tax=Streptomyces sp. NPDC126514 TaxID=3155210 RepID=UPI003333DFFB